MKRESTLSVTSCENGCSKFAFDMRAEKLPRLMLELELAMLERVAEVEEGDRGGDSGGVSRGRSEKNDFERDRMNRTS